MPITHVSPGFYGSAFAGSAPENYEKFFVPAIGGPLARELVRTAALRPGERVLDVACGTGAVTRLAAEGVGPTGTVAGADVNAGMLAVARHVTAASARLPIQWYETAAEAMPIPDTAYDVVFCQLALQFFADRGAALREIHRVLAAGGRAYLSVPAPTAFFGVFEQAVTRYAGTAFGAFVAQVFSLSDPDELQRLCQDAGFRTVDVRTDVRLLRLANARDFLWQYVYSTPLAGPIGELDTNEREAFERDVVNGWAPWSVDGGLQYEQPVLTTSLRK